MTAATGGPHSTWSSPLAAALQRFLEGKRAAGYRYRAEAKALGVLDRFLGETLSPTDPVITSDIVRAFVARRGTESETTRAHRLTLLREVCRFLALDDPRTFVPAARFLGIHRPLLFFSSERPEVPGQVVQDRPCEVSVSARRPPTTRSPSIRQPGVVVVAPAGRRARSLST